MKIIKDGLSYEEIKKKREEIEKKREGIRCFKCDFCDCVFEAEQNEYKCNQYYTGELIYTCLCPKCNEFAHEDKTIRSGINRVYVINRGWHIEIKGDANENT